ncbi:hypothetical protein F4803DRAFT_539945 [Xylaria telfairii]|nr:hypothetical protein F4803DRAFT_539945 [Xylaria telfairii]
MPLRNLCTGLKDSWVSALAFYVILVSGDFLISITSHVPLSDLQYLRSTQYHLLLPVAMISLFGRVMVV